MSQEAPDANQHPSDYYDRYSRQHYVLGEAAMNRMAKSNVFISGLGGLGIEIGACASFVSLFHATRALLGVQHHFSPQEL